MNNFEIIIYRNMEDISFIAEVPELAGCMADGKTYIEAVENVEIVMDEWIETIRLLNRTIDYLQTKN